MFGCEYIYLGYTRPSQSVGPARYERGEKNNDKKQRLDAASTGRLHKRKAGDEA